MSASEQSKHQSIDQSIDQSDYYIPTPNVVIQSDTKIPHIPKLFMISYDNGANIYAKKLDKSIKYDEHLLSAALSALRIFLKESLKVTQLNSMMFDDLHIKMMSSGEIIFFYIYKGRHEGTQLLQKFRRKLQRKKCWKRLKANSLSITHKDSDTLDELVSTIFKD